MNNSKVEYSLLDEFDNLYRTAHEGLLPTEEGFECNLHHCPGLYNQIRQILTEHKPVEQSEPVEYVCAGCGKKTTEVYPSYNHPEADPCCFDCLPNEVKKQLRRQTEPVDEELKYAIDWIQKGVESIERRVNDKDYFESCHKQAQNDFLYQLKSLKTAKELLQSRPERIQPREIVYHDAQHWYQKGKEEAQPKVSLAFINNLVYEIAEKGLDDAIEYTISFPF